MGKIKYIQDEKSILIPSSDEVVLVVERCRFDDQEKKEIVIEKNARVQYVIVSDVDGFNENVARRHFRLQENSNLSLRYLFLGEGSQRWHLEHDIESLAKIDCRCLAIGCDRQSLSVRADYDFRGQGSFGRISADASLSGHSYIKYDANVNVLPSAQKSDTRVDLRLRLDGKEAKGDMTPGLNIAANDVRAGHSASTFRLSSEDLFYLRSRGLSLSDISSLFSKSLANIFVQGLDEEVKKELSDIITTHI